MLFFATSFRLFPAGFAANLEIREILEKSFTFSRQEKVREFEKILKIMEKSRNLVGP